LLGFNSNSLMTWSFLVTVILPAVLKKKLELFFTWPVKETEFKKTSFILGEREKFWMADSILGFSTSETVSKRWEPILPVAWLKLSVDWIVFWFWKTKKV